MRTKCKPKIKAVIFDWAGVFCSAGEPFSHPGLTLQTHLNFDEMGKQTADIQRQYYTGAIDSKEFWRQVSDLLRLAGLSETELREAYLTSYNIRPEMFKLASILKQKYRTMLLSNLTPDMTADIKARYGVEKYFHYAVFSNEIGLMKPDVKIFEFAIKKLNTSMKNTLFIDDSNSNIKAAKKLGFVTILFKNPVQCMRELENLGITAD